MRIVDKFQQITLRTILEVFTPISLLSHNWNPEDEYDVVWKAKKQYLVKLLVDEVQKGRLHGAIAGMYIDINGNEAEERPANDFILDENQTWFNTEQAFALLNGYLKLNHAQFDQTNQSFNAEAQQDVEGGEYTYPTYRGVKLEDVSKEMFEKIKKDYGMLQRSESKWRTAVPIAAKIGLLFYERSLGKPTTRPAFLKAYKEEFDALLRNDTVASYIYDSLPGRYRGDSAARETTVDLTPVIKAAVYAGSIYDVDDVQNLEKLKAELKEHQYKVPSDDILSYIIKAVKEI